MMENQGNQQTDWQIKQKDADNTMTIMVRYFHAQKIFKIRRHAANSQLG